MDSYQLLDQASEDALHRKRPLYVDEKAYKRVRSRFLPTNSTSILTWPPRPQEASVDEGKEAVQSELPELSHGRGDILLDFAAFEANLVRIQLLLSSNIAERERYAAKRLEIQQETQDVKQNTIELRTHLAKAQETLAQRKEWDKLALKMTSNRALKPRDEQNLAIHNLHEEIAELEQESRDYALTWSERRIQFSRLIDEGMQLRRQIRDEKEEVERREGMADEGGDENDGSSRRGGLSSLGTPRPDGLGHSSGGETPSHMADAEKDDRSVNGDAEKGLHPLSDMTRLAPSNSSGAPSVAGDAMEEGGA